MGQNFILQPGAPRLHMPSLRALWLALLCVACVPDTGVGPDADGDTDNVDAADQTTNVDTKTDATDISAPQQDADDGGTIAADSGSELNIPAETRDQTKRAT